MHKPEVVKREGGVEEDDQQRPIGESFTSTPPFGKREGGDQGSHRWGKPAEQLMRALNIQDR